MIDLIDRQAALDLFPDDDLEWDTYCGYVAPHFAKRMIKELPSAQPEEHTNERSKTHACDLISRQAAIDALGEEPPVWYDGEDEIAERNQWKRDIEAIEQLPPIQPEIIRCKDCKHWDGADTCDVIDAPVWDNDFCSMAERRSDE